MCYESDHLDPCYNRGLYRVFWDTGYWPIFLRDTGIFVFFILGYGIFRNFGIWDIGIYLWIQVKLILGYGIFWMVYFGIMDIAYPLTKPHNRTFFLIFLP